jgi:hypothetical protein
MPPAGKKRDLIEQRAGKESVEHSRQGGGELVLDSIPTGIKDQISVMGLSLGFFYSNCLNFANFNAAFAAETLFCVDRNGLFVFEFENLNRTNFDTLTAASTLISVHTWNEHKKGLLSLILSICYELETHSCVKMSYALLHQLFKLVKSSF